MTLNSLVIYCLLLAGTAAYLHATVPLYMVFVLLTVVAIFLNMQSARATPAQILTLVAISIGILSTTLIAGSLEIVAFMASFLGAVAAWAVASNRTALYPAAVAAMCSFILFELYVIYLNGFDPVLLYLDTRTSFSWNHVSIVHAFLSLFVITTAPRHSPLLGRVFVILGLVFAIFGLSRGGTLAFLLIGFWTFFIAPYRTMNKKVAVGAAFLAALVVFSPLFMDQVLQFLSHYAFRFYNLTYGVRGEVLQEYMTDLTLPQVLLGKDIGRIASEELGNNVHNSLIRVHSKYGLLGLALTVGVVVRLTVLGNLVGLAIILRIFSESVVGGTPADFMLILLYLLFEARRRDLRSPLEVTPPPERGAPLQPYGFPSKSFG